MTKKIFVGITITFFAVSAFALGICFAEKTKEDSIFEERLIEWVNVDNELNPDNSQSTKRLEEALYNLQKFYQDYPNNKYSDDAEFIYLKSIAAPEKEWEKFVAQYPNEKIEEFTKEQLRKLKGNFSNFVYELCIPYDLLLGYVKGQKAWMEDRDYEEAVSYLSQFVKKLDYSNPDLKEASRPAYFGLLVSYKKLNKKEDYEKVKEEMIVLFPEKKERLEGFWSSPDPK